jgi:hypothetical protein
MSEQNHIELIEKFIAERNYLSAYISLKEGTLSREKEIEYIGKITQNILTDITYSTGRKNKEKVYYYRSLLLMIFQEVPGLARVYRHQLQESRGLDSPLNILKQLKNLADITTDNTELKESIENAIEDISDKIEDVKEDIEDKNLDEPIKDIFSLAEEGIKEGLKGFNNFLKNITSPPPETKTNTEETDEKTMKRAEPIEDEQSADKEEKEPGNKEEE